MTVTQEISIRYKSPSPAEKEYVATVGQAIFSFSTMEWNIISVAQSLEDNFISEEMYRKTSGWVIGRAKSKIEDKLDQFDASTQERLTRALQRAIDAIELRNDLIHTYPCSSPEGKNILTRRKAGAQELWNLNDIDAATRHFDEISQDFNDILHNHLLKHK